MADDVLKSFLIAIGYKEDAASRKKMTDGLAKVEKAVASLSLALVAATTAATAAAVKMAASFEDLFYASQRTGASINNLRGLAYAVSQLGGSYGGAVQSLEAFAKNIRTNPGYESMARKLGVATQENGKLRDTVDILTDLGRVFKGQRYEIAYQYAQALGLDEKTFQLLRDQPDALRRYRDEYERTTKALGTNTKEMTEQGKALSQSWRSFLSVMEALSERIAATFFPIITKLLDYMREWVVTHGPQINAFWTQVGQGIEVVERAAKSAYDTVEPFVTLIAKKLSEGFNATGGAAETLKEMKQLFSDIGDMVKRAYEYIVKLIQLVGLDKVAAALGAGIKGGFRLEDYTGPGGMPDLSGGGVAGAGGGAGGIPPGATGKGALAPFKRGFFGRLKDAVVGPRPSIRKGYQAGSAGGDGAGGVVDAGRFTALKNLIQGKESGSRSYTSVYGNGRYGEPPKPITEMTVEEVLEWQRQMKAKVGSPAFPVGRAQFVESTLRRLATKTGTLKEKLSPALQERFFDMLIQGRGRSVSGLRSEWEGLNRVSPDEILRAYDKEGPTATSQSPKEGRLPNGRPIGQATNVSDEEVIANDHGHWNRVTKALGNMDFAKRHGASDAPLGVTNTDNSSSKSLVFSPKTEINVMGGSDPQATANQTVGALTRFQELSLRNAQGAIR